MLRDVDINGEFSTNQLQKLEDLGVSDRIGEKLCHWVALGKASLPSPACGGFLWIFPESFHKGFRVQKYTLADVHRHFSVICLGRSLPATHGKVLHPNQPRKYGGGSDRIWLGEWTLNCWLVPLPHKNCQAYDDPFFFDILDELKLPDWGPNQKKDPNMS